MKESINIILIDDDDIDLNLLYSILQESEYNIEILDRISEKGLSKPVIEVGSQRILDLLPKLDLLFLDIKLEPGTGFDLLEKVYKKANDNNLSTNFDIVFVSGHLDEYKNQTNRYNGIFQVPKPPIPEDVHEAIALYVKRRRDLSNSKSKKNECRNITVKSTKAIYFLNLDSIVRLEGDGNSTKFYLSKSERLKQGKKISYLSVSGSIGHCFAKYFDKLDGFYRVHSGHVINSRFMTQCLPDYSQITLVDWDSSSKKVETHHVQTAGNYRKFFKLLVESGKL